METTPEENGALVRRFLIDVIEGGDTGASDSFVAEDAVDHDLVFGDQPTPGGVTALGWQVLAAADVEISIRDVVATNNQVAVRATVSGTHQESLIDLAPTGESFEIAYVWFCRVTEGEIAEIWSFPDGLGLMTQLGVLSTVSGFSTESSDDQQSANGSDNP